VKHILAFVFLVPFIPVGIAARLVVEGLQVGWRIGKAFVDWTVDA
jgi:hypothetical protein